MGQVWAGNWGNNMGEQNSRWDLGRFIKTLAYFGVVPLLRSLDWFQTLVGNRPHRHLAGSPKADLPIIVPQRSQVILVAGASSGIGKGILQRLKARGYALRVLVGDPEQAQDLPIDSDQWVAADISRSDLSNPELMTDVGAIIACSEEYEEIKALVQLGKRHLNASVQVLPIFDFEQSPQNLQDTWGAVDDVVMGGVSASEIKQEEKAALFTGTVSTANSGGFASVRTRNFESGLDLAGFDGIELHLGGDGQRYKFMLRTETKWDGIAYSSSFDTEPDSWQIVRIPFAELIPVFRAKTVQDADLPNLSSIRAFQLMLSKFEYDGDLNSNFETGSFQLQIKSIQAYRHCRLPQFVLISTAGVTRPQQPDREETIHTQTLRQEAAVRESGLAYTIVRPCALTDVAGGASLIVDQGDTLEGEVSAADVAELCVQALENPQACEVTFEVAAAAGGCQPGDWQCLFASLKPDPVLVSDRA